MWVMHSKVTHKPWCLTFYIGAVQIAEISFHANKKSWLCMWGERFGPFNTVSAAMTKMHELLNSPPDHIERPDGED